jgi:predicted nucleic acid-binding protein
VIVVDASAVVDLLLVTSRGPWVAAALARRPEAHVPELLDPEVLAVVRRWRHRGWIEPHAADRAVDELGDLAVVRHGHAPLRARMWAVRDRCSPYDACYVALAESLDAELLTTDDRLARAAGGLVPIVNPG